MSSRCYEFGMSDVVVQLKNSKQDSEVGDSSAPPTKKVRIPRLTGIPAVRREIGRQYGMHLRGEIGNKTLHVRVFALKSLRDSFVADDQEQRLRALEEREKANAR